MWSITDKRMYSSSEAESIVAELVRTSWKTEFNLCVTKVSSFDEDGWHLTGTLSKPTAIKPIPSECVQLEFKVYEDAVQYRIEKNNFWYDGNDFHDSYVEFIMEDKSEIRKKYKNLIFDDFGATRNQISFEKEVEEERKIAEEAKVQYYSDESDEELFEDDPDFLKQLDSHQGSSEKRNIREMISRLISNGFDNVSTYENIVDLVDMISRELKLPFNSRLVLLGSIRLNDSSVLDTLTHVAKSLLQRHAFFCDLVINAEYVTVQFPELETRVNPLILKALESHDRDEEGKRESIPAADLIDLLVGDGTTLVHAEAQSIVLSLLAEDDQQSRLETNSLKMRIHQVRMAHAEYRFMKFHDPDQVARYLEQTFGDNLKDEDVAGLISRIAADFSHQQMFLSVEELSRISARALGTNEENLIESFAKASFAGFEPASVMQQQLVQSRYLSSHSNLPVFSTMSKQSLVHSLKDINTRDAVKLVGTIVDLSEKQISSLSAEAAMLALGDKMSASILFDCLLSIHIMLELKAFARAEMVLETKATKAKHDIGPMTITSLELSDEGNYDIYVMLDQNGEEYYGSFTTEDMEYKLGAKDLTSLMEEESDLRNILKECLVVSDSKVLVHSFPKHVWSAKLSNHATYIDDIRMTIDVYMRHDNMPYWKIEAKEVYVENPGKTAFYQGYLARSLLSKDEQNAKSILAFQKIFDRLRIAGSTFLVLPSDD